MSTHTNMTLRAPNRSTSQPAKVPVSPMLSCDAVKIDDIDARLTPMVLCSGSTYRLRPPNPTPLPMNRRNARLTTTHHP